jgi:histidine triad (HIT) family protein
VTEPRNGLDNHCVFCDIVRARVPAKIVHATYTNTVIAFEPLNPVTEGHLLVVPSIHVEDALQNPFITGETMRWAAEWVRDEGPCNLITSCGAEATQTIRHLHIHIVPRRADDGLLLPWSENPLGQIWLDPPWEEP